MDTTNVILIFDIGKTNKKVLLFNDSYELVHEKSVAMQEVTDEEGDPCESLVDLERFIQESITELFTSGKYSIKAINFSAYGASWVYVDTNGKPLTPLYNYLKQYPRSLQNRFYRHYGDEEIFCLETASPALGSLNSGLQLYRIKYEQPRVFERIWYALHLPQYLSFLLSENTCSEITSIGCHTALWNYGKDEYHGWVFEEGVAEKLPSLVNANTAFPTTVHQQSVLVGTGMHDSSAALVPYLETFKEPFLLLSTGTWCISLNPFNDRLLTISELRNDCLCYLSYEGKSVKASRLFSGYEHEQQVKRLAQFFNKPVEYYKEVTFNINLLPANTIENSLSTISSIDLSIFPDYETAYHHVMDVMVKAQVRSSSLVLEGSPVKKIYVEGGFSRNPLFMAMLAIRLGDMEVYAASMPQASALGAALVMHGYWNDKPVPEKLVHLERIETPINQTSSK